MIMVFSYVCSNVRPASLWWQFTVLNDGFSSNICIWFKSNILSPTVNSRWVIDYDCHYHCWRRGRMMRNDVYVSFFAYIQHMMITSKRDIKQKTNYVWIVRENYVLKVALYSILSAIKMNNCRNTTHKETGHIDRILVSRCIHLPSLLLLYFLHRSGSFCFWAGQ